MREESNINKDYPNINIVVEEETRMKILKITNNVKQQIEKILEKKNSNSNSNINDLPYYKEYSLIKTKLSIEGFMNYIKERINDDNINKDIPSSRQVTYKLDIDSFIDFFNTYLKEMITINVNEAADDENKIYEEIKLEEEVIGNEYLEAAANTKILNDLVLENYKLLIESNNNEISRSNKYLTEDDITMKLDYSNYNDKFLNNDHTILNNPINASIKNNNKSINNSNYKNKENNSLNSNVIKASNSIFTELNETLNAKYNRAGKIKSSLEKAKNNSTNNDTNQTTNNKNNIDKKSKINIKSSYDDFSLKLFNELKKEVHGIEDKAKSISILKKFFEEELINRIKEDSILEKEDDAGAGNAKYKKYDYDSLISKINDLTQIEKTLDLKLKELKTNEGKSKKQRTVFGILFKLIIVVIAFLIFSYAYNNLTFNQ